MIKSQTPPPAPPLEGRGAATALLAAWDSVGTPLPSRGGVGGGVCNQGNVYTHTKSRRTLYFKRQLRTTLNNNLSFPVSSLHAEGASLHC